MIFEFDIINNLGTLLKESWTFIICSYRMRKSRYDNQRGEEETTRVYISNGNISFQKHLLYVAYMTLNGERKFPYEGLNQF